MLALETATRVDFLPALNGQFQISGPGLAQPVVLTLTAVEARGAAHPPFREPFALVFQGAPSLRLPQSIYRLENETLGVVELFVVQNGATATESLFEVVVS